MTERIRLLKKFFVSEKAHHAVRFKPGDEYSLAEEFSRREFSDVRRAAQRLQAMLRMEEPVLFPEERIVLTRRNPTVPSLFTEKEMDALKGSRKLHERGEVCNISVDYTLLLNTGFLAKREELLRRATEFREAGQVKEAEYVLMQEEILGALQDLCDRYRELALKEGRTETASMLFQVPMYAPRTFPEALQMFRILHFAMWIGGNYHNTVGRFDQYMYPYFKADMDAGRLTRDSALEWIEELFLTFNRDSDLYPGMQQGDNGQSIMLGGLDPDGKESYNELSQLCLKASLELSLIDPKINLRVSKSTPLSVFKLGSELTRQGLGFPQYANDDIVIPALIAYGYAKEDACNYVVAACWEFIVPGSGMDIPNIAAVSLASAVQQAVALDLEGSQSFDDLLKAAKRRINDQAVACVESTGNLYVFPAPFLSLMMDGCVEKAQDVSLGCKYNNYGIHGTGIATAADALAAVRKYVYGDGSVSKRELLSALETDYRDNADLLAKLRYDAPKMGNNDPEVDDLAVELLDAFADSLAGRVNERGGIFRAGTGSAMYYVWHAKSLPATADGRRAGEGLGANYSPSLFARLKGPISILQSFSKPHLKRVCNGGPLTLELHDTMFRNDQAIEKVAVMVKSFMDMGGQQLQLNAINRDALLAAQKNPNDYRNLIVRVWGWSGYFVELDKEYQEHIISRMEHAM